jgi:elongation factor G
MRHSSRTTVGIAEMPDDDAPFLIEIAIEAKSKTDQEKLDIALAKLAGEDPSFGVSTDRESGQTILKGLSELHLDAKVAELKRSGVGFRIGAPQVAFRETITRRVEHSFTHKRQTGGTGQFASVTMVVEPIRPGKGYEFESTIVGHALPARFFPGVKRGVESVLSSGIVAGFPVTGIKVRLIDAKYHDIDSSELAFEIAARSCFRETLQKAGAILIEPIVKVEVMTPELHVGPIMADLKLRRGQIQSQDTRVDAVVIHALVPLMNMFDYASALREESNGRASFAMQFDRYAPAHPPDDDPFGPAVGMRA